MRSIKNKILRTQKIVRSLVLSASCMALFISVDANAATVVLNGNTYTISTFTGSYNSNTPYFNTTYMPWYGNAGLSNSAAFQLGSQLGYPNGFGPFFTSGTVNSNSVSVYYVSPFIGGVFNGDYLYPTIHVFAFFNPATNITGAGTYLSSNLGSTVNPVLDGGTLTVSSAGVISPNFTITANNGKIDQNGLSAQFSGVISDAGPGVNGKLTILNSGVAGQGSVALTGVNTYSGGTEVDAGADLIISSAAALGSGALTLVGTNTTPATLSTTHSMSIGNSIRVSGDPVFNVTSGTTTTITTAIIDGGTPGDVVVQGGGTLNLTAQNTYTGATSIAAGSTLALSGSGLIASSSSVINNGTFNLAAAANRVVLGGSYVQSASGNLSLLFSPSNVQGLNISKNASLAGTLTLNASPGTYRPGEYTLVSANGLTGRFSTFVSNLTSLTKLGFNLSYDANDVFLTLTPSVADTQTSVASSAAALRGVYGLQTEEIDNGLNYDCGLFDKNGICVSTGGRYIHSSTSHSDSSDGLLIGAIRLNDRVRVGAWAEQNIGNTAPSGIKLGDGNPMLGLFGVWNQNANGSGLEVRIAAGYGDRDVTVTRAAMGLTSEPGSGTTTLKTSGASAVVSYNIPVLSQWSSTPYAGIRYTSDRASAYREGGSASVTAPLSFGDLTEQSTAALAGVRVSDEVASRMGLYGSVGVEQDLSDSSGNYTATGIVGLTSVALNSNIRKTRPVATVGAYYALAKTQRINFDASYRAEAFQASNATTVMLTYSAGF